MTLTQILSDANTLLSDPENQALMALYDPNTQPLRLHLDVEAETAMRNTEKRTLSGIARISDGLQKVTEDIANPDIHDEVKADILVKLNALVNGV